MAWATFVRCFQFRVKGVRNVRDDEAKRIRPLQNHTARKQRGPIIERIDEGLHPCPCPALDVRMVRCHSRHGGNGYAGGFRHLSYGKSLLCHSCPGVMFPSQHRFAMVRSESRARHGQVPIRDWPSRTRASAVYGDSGTADRRRSREARLAEFRRRCSQCADRA